MIKNKTFEKTPIFEKTRSLKKMTQPTIRDKCRQSTLIRKHIGMTKSDDYAKAAVKTFIQQIMGGDHKNISYLQQFLSYCFDPDYNNSRIHMWIGDGDNGKSTLLNMLFKIFPEPLLHKRYPDDTSDINKNPNMVIINENTILDDTFDTEKYPNTQFLYVGNSIPNISNNTSHNILMFNSRFVKTVTGVNQYLISKETVNYLMSPPCLMALYEWILEGIYG